MQWKRAAVLATAAVMALVAPRALSAQETRAAATRPQSDDASAASGADRTIGITVQQLFSTLSNPAAPPADLLEAARRLVARQTPDSREELRKIVKSAGNASRLATLRALADDPNPDQSLLQDLRALLNNENEKLVEGAAVALAAYKGNAQATKALSDAALDGARKSQLRVPTIQALGLLVEQPAAATLVKIMTNPRESPDMIAAAADALVQMTALDANGRDPAKWAQWQKANAEKSPGEWSETVLRARSAREDRLARRDAELADDTQRLLVEIYQSTPADRQADQLLDYLRGSTPSVRRVGAQMAGRVASKALPGQYTPEIERRLIELIGDADAGVRLDVAKILYELGVPDAALDTLVAQLRVETDNEIKIALARNLGDIPSITQVNDLAGLLNDESPEVIEEAANAIRKRVPDVLKQDAALAKQTAEKLRNTMQRLAGRAGAAYVKARVACGEALAAFKDERSREFAISLLNKREPWQIRGVAMQILGELGPSASNAIIRAIDEEPEPEARVKGMQALARTRSFDQPEWLGQRMKRGGVEPDPHVRAAALQAYLALLPYADPRRLDNEATKYMDNPELRIAILKALVKKHEDAGKPKEAALNKQNIGYEYLNKMKPSQPAEAARYLREALDYWLTSKGDPTVIDPLLTQLIRALLDDGQYVPLTTLAKVLMKDASPQATKAYKEKIGGMINSEVNKLLEANRPADLDKATKLIDTALTLDENTLDDFYRRDLTRRGAELQKRRDAGTR